MSETTSTATAVQNAQTGVQPPTTTGQETAPVVTVTPDVQTGVAEPQTPEVITQTPATEPQPQPPVVLEAPTAIDKAIIDKQISDLSAKVADLTNKIDVIISDVKVIDKVQPTHKSGLTTEDILKNVIKNGF